MANNDPLYRSRILTSLYGSRLGLDTDNMLVGPPELKLGVTTPGSTANNLPAHGVSNLAAAAASTIQLDPPITGIRKYLFANCTAASSINVLTGVDVVGLASSISTGGRRIKFQAQGDVCELVGLSTALWGILNCSAGVCLTTST